jgi:hypothetical protein
MAPPKRNVDELIAETNKAIDEAYENAEASDRDALLDAVQNHLSAKWDELTSDEGDSESDDDEDESDED